MALNYVEHKILGPNPMVILDTRDNKLKLIRRDGYYTDLQMFQQVPDWVQYKVLKARRDYAPSEFLIWDER